jgi:hypothetical protein
VLDAPLLARLLTVASLTGIVNLLGGEGIAFEQLDAPFVVRDDLLQLDKGRVYGSQLGLTFEGRLDLAADSMNLDGTIVPLYGVNWTLGRIPIIGQLLRGSKGEGAFAATYAMRGPVSEPRISVNPLSALAPGFLRELFSGWRRPCVAVLNSMQAQMGTDRSIRATRCRISSRYRHGRDLVCRHTKPSSLR